MRSNYVCAFLRVHDNIAVFHFKKDLYSKTFNSFQIIINSANSHNNNNVQDYLTISLKLKQHIIFHASFKSWWFLKNLNHVKQFINKESKSDWVFCVLNIYHCQSLNRTNLLLKCKTMNDWSFFDTLIRFYRQIFINLWSIACKTYI